MSNPSQPFAFGLKQLFNIFHGAQILVRLVLAYIGIPTCGIYLKRYLDIGIFMAGGLGNASDGMYMHLLIGRYPLVMTNIAMEKKPFLMENSLFLWPFSIDMLVYQRVHVSNIDFGKRFQQACFDASGTIQD